MNKLLSIIGILFFSNCASQKAISKIPGSDITYLSLTKQKDCTNEIKIFNNQDDFNKFQSSLEKSGPRSAPLFVIDFTTKNVVAICKSDIGAFQIKDIEVRKKSNILNLEKIEGYDNYSNTSNTLLLEIPKQINTLELNK